MRRFWHLVLFACLLGIHAAPAAAAQRDVLTGTLVDLHGHRADGSQTGRVFAIRDARGLHVLADEQAERLLGQRVRVVDRSAAAGVQGEVRAVGEQRLAPAAVGDRTLLVILVTTTDAPTAAASADAARSAVFSSPASANALYEQQSAGATRFIGRVRADGDVTEPLQLAVALRGCNTAAVANAADSAARADGWAVDAYAHVLYILPRTTECPWAGLGELPGRRLYSNGDLATRVTAHELGHNLGAHHANSLRCTGAGGAGVTLSATCSSSEYGDPFDVMGLSAFLMSSWHRAQIGQLPVGQELRARESQTLALVSSDDFSLAGPRLLLVPLKLPRMTVASWLAVELRSSLSPFDLWETGAPVTTGVSVRRVPNLTAREQSQLLDAQPATVSRSDAPLQPGETLRSEPHGVSLRLNSVDGTTANVTVTMPTLIDDVAPTPPWFLAALGNTSAVTLNWGDASDDEAIGHYEIERDGVIIGTTTGRTFEDTRVAELSTATYRVIAVDTSANRAASGPRRITLADVTAPGAPPGLSAAASAGAVVLSWADAADNRAIGGYRVVRDGQVLADTGATSYTDGTATAGSHRYEVSAADTAGNRGPAAVTEVTVPAQPDPASAVGSLSAPAAGPAPSAAPVRRPRIVLRGRSSQATRRGRVVVLRLAADGASSLRAYRGGRQIAGSPGSRLTVRIALPRRAAPRTIRIVASWAGGTVSRNVLVR